MSDFNFEGEFECVDFLSESAEQTRLFASKFAKSLPSDSFIALSGDLGAGKTTFVKGLAEGLGITTTVKSPSFNVMLVYDRADGFNLVHIDAYRLGSSDDFENLMIDEIAPEPRCICVEWWSNIADCVPPDAYEVSLSIDPDTQHHHIKIKRGIA